jgi:hypothetical protein
MAAVVPIAAVVMLAIVIMLNMGNSGSKATTGVLPKASGNSGLSVSTVNPFAPYVYSGEPVPDILNAVLLPAGAVQVAVPHVGGEATSFDRSIVFRSPASQQALYSFFSEQMKARGWKIFSTGIPAGGQKGVEVLAQKAGSDGWYWEQGVVISPTIFASDNSQSTRFTLRLYQASDSQ